MTVNNLSLKLNGRVFSMGELKIYAEGVLANKESEPYEVDVFRFILDWLDEREFIEVKTSGSTGIPKEVKLLKKWMLHSALKTCRYFDLTERSTLLLCLPASFIAGRMMIVRAFACGANLIIVEPDSNPFQKVTSFIDFAAITPYQLIHSLETLKKKGNVNKIIAGGGEISIQLENSLQDLPIEIYSTYGMTETCSHIALRKVNGAKKTDFFEVMEGVDINVDERGCLVINEPELGVINLPTNDLVEIVDEKSFRWLGRWDNVINTGGLKMIPEQWEIKIAHLHPSRMILISMPDFLLGNAVALVVESENLTNEETRKLRNNIQQITGKYLAPKIILNLPHFPETPTGKPDRFKIADWAARKKASL